MTGFVVLTLKNGSDMRVNPAFIVSVRDTTPPDAYGSFVHVSWGYGGNTYQVMETSAEIEDQLRSLNRGK
jgi:hypothetical protein